MSSLSLIKLSGTKAYREVLV